MKRKITFFLLFVFCTVFANAQTNVALKTPKTATASSGTASAAVDGDLGTRWTAATSTTEYIKVDLGADRDISAVKITWETAKAASFKVTFITDAGVTVTSQTQNGTNPLELVNGTVNNFAVTARARYVQIDCQTPSTPYPYSIYEIEVTDNSPNPISSASSAVGGNTAANAIDGNSSTRWESASSTNINDPQFLIVNLGVRYDISEIKILWENAKAADFNIDFSNDGTTWTTGQSFTGNTNLLIDYTFTSKNAQYVRINCLAKTAALSQYGYSIYSLEVYQTPTVLPVSLLDFQTKMQTNGRVSLNWSTASELNNNYFLIERSADGKNFTQIGQVASKGSNSRLDYSFTDATPFKGLNYYKLTQVDFDGGNKTLGIKSQNVSISTANSILYPNPLQGNKLYLSLANQADGSVSVSINNLLGKTIYQGKVNVVSGTATVPLSVKPVSGVYLVNVEGQNFRLIVE